MSVADYCANCNHHRRFHGDRAVGGTCSHGMYPRVCGCEMWVAS